MKIGTHCTKKDADSTAENNPNTYPKFYLTDPPNWPKSLRYR